MDWSALDDFELDMGTSGEWGLLAAIFIMVLAVALDLKPQNFRFLRDKPRVFWGGLIAQLLGLPTLTLALCFAFNPHPTLALGMIIVACCPGGSVSNLMTMFARGNTALSISLTATSSLLAAFFTPVAILFWTGLYPPTASILKTIGFDPFGFLAQIFIILALPLFIGMSIVRAAPKLAVRLKSALAALGAGLLVLIILSMTVRFWDQIIALSSDIIGLVIIHNTLALSLGYAMGCLFRVDEPSKRAYTIEVGIQNSGLALVILISQLSGLGGAAVIAGLWGIWHIIGGLLAIAIFRLSDRLDLTSHG